MDLENKLISDLPWSQKFRDFESWEENLGPVHVRSYSYADCRMMAQISTYEQQRGNIMVTNIITQYWILYVNSYMMETCRLGGPASYKIDPDNGSISKPVFYLREIRVSPYTYWQLMCGEFGSVYSKTEEGTNVYFKAKFNFPCPYSYSIKSKRFVWRLNGKSVSFSDYWRWHETRFTDLRSELKNYNAWGDFEMEVEDFSDSWVEDI